MKRITVLTAAHESAAHWLSETAQSVMNQSLPDGWELEWIVQEDGKERTLHKAVPSDSRIQLEANGSHLGAAVTRNLGLSRASGALLQNLDADDLLLPGALETLIAVFEQNSNVHWALGQADDLMPDGSRKTFPPDLPFGVVPAGAVNSWASAHGANWPVHCAGVMYRTESLRALGGWAAVPFDEDLVLLNTLSEVTDGWFDQTHTWLYRQHENQLVRSVMREQWSDAGRRIALQRARAALHAGLVLTTPGLDADSRHTDFAVAPPMKSAPEL